MKQRVGFLFTGQARSNPLSFNQNHNYAILESFTNNIFTNEFKEKFDYDIFISTDDIHLQKTFDYFGIDHVKNIHILEPIFGGQEFYLKDVNYKLQRVNYYLNMYSQQNFMDCESYPGSILQNYKVLDAFHLLEQNRSNYDFIIRIRLDVIFIRNIMDCFNKFSENPDLHIIGQHDFFFIGKPLIMKFYCTSLDRKYGKYNFNITNHVFKANVIDYETYNNNFKKQNYKRWTYAPEIQVWETLFEFCSINNLDIDKTINGIHIVDYIPH